MYPKILLACDAEGLARSAVPIVAGLAREAAGEVLVLAVAAPDAGSKLRSALEGHARAAAQELALSGVRSRYQVRSGERAADKIVGTATHWGADLVVLGSHGRGDLAGLFVGSVGHRVAAHLELPILLVRSGADGSGSVGPTQIVRILLAVDHSDSSKAAVRVARGLAREHGATVEIVHVREIVPVSQVPLVEPEADITTLLSDARRLLEEAGVAVTTVPLWSGPTTEAIANAADRFDADLIVMGSRRLTDLGGLLLGSTAHGVMRRTHRPVLLAERS